VLCDDAYAGLVYEEGIPRGSMFWELAGRHPDLAPVKIDGATKEFSFFGGRVGFLTFALAPDSAAAAALESKVKCLLRATVGSPVAASQAVVLAGLTSPNREAEVEAVRRLLAERYRALKQALAACDPALLAPLPFNSGCFAVIELTARLGVAAEAVRRHLLDRHDTGVISIEPRFLRLAHCSVAADAIPELVRRIEAGVRELVES
jgi:aspartate/methionine/tyrosine aminotransferase